MKQFQLFIIPVAISGLLLVSCLDANPHWVGPRSDSKRWYDTGSTLPEAGPPDLGPSGDGPRADLPPVADQLPPPPDIQPTLCSKDSQCNDKLSCTVDRCVNGKCQHNLIKDRCLIGGQCFGPGDANSANSCQACDPATSISQWSSAPDNTPCAKDGLSCTNDYCVKGKCEHPVTSGCMIGGKCYSDGDSDPSDPCKACLPTLSKTVFKPADGLPCTPAANKPGMCVASKCQGFDEGTWSPPNAASASLTSVDELPAAKGVWAAGGYTVSGQPGEKGLLVEVSALAAGKAPATALTNDPMTDLHHDMAVGMGGMAMRYANGAWKTAAAVYGALAGANRLSVWGSSTGYYLGGQPTSSAPAVLACKPGTSGTLTCTKHTGISSGRTIGRLFGTLLPTGQGPLWGALVGSSTPEDIYFNSGLTATWSTQGPQGCHDSGNNPCANTSWNLLDMEGSGADDIWVTGTSGGLLRYDGKKWSKVTNAFPSQTQYDLTAVYSSKADGLTTVAAVRNDSGSTGRRVYLFNYNMALDAWFGPVVLYQGPQNTEVVLLDMGGKGYNDLWLVGHREVVSSGATTVKGWVLRLK